MHVILILNNIFATLATDNAKKKKGNSIQHEPNSQTNKILLFKFESLVNLPQYHYTDKTN